MKNWKIFLGVILIFVLGVLAGLVPGFYVRHRFPPPLPPPMQNNERNEMILNRFARDLNLTQDQKAQVGQIMAQTRKKLDEHFVQRVQPELQKLMNEEFAQIEKALDDSQKRKFRVLRERMDRDLKRPEYRP
jgi:Spy/CpxP family protein refolding chaperone